MDAVGDILWERRGQKPEWKAGVAGTVVLHAVVLVVLLTGIHLAPPHRFVSPQAVAVRLVPVGSLRPQAAPPQATSEPSRPVIQKAEPTPPPSPRALPLPRAKETPAPPAPARVSPKARHVKETAAPVELPGESPGVAPSPESGSAAFGASVSSFDAADFNYSYYISRMLAMIGANWFKPTDQPTSAPVVYFRIDRSGAIAEAKIEKSSGLPFVDRAALRAVLLASPLPPLPVEFSGDSLGVHIKFN